MSHRYVEIASEIAAFAPVEAAELATADDTGLITSARAGTSSGRCPGKFALGRAVAEREAAVYAVLASPAATEMVCDAARKAAEETLVERVETRQNRSWRDDDGALRDGAVIVVRRYMDRAGRDPAHRVEIDRRLAVVAADPDVSAWRKFGAPKSPTTETLCGGPSTVASGWDHVKARWARLDALLAMLAAPIASSVGVAP